MAMKKGEKSKRVKEFQEALIVLGYPLHRWGADGGCGDETMQAASACLIDLGRGVVEGDFRTSIADKDVDFVIALSQEDRSLPASFVDLRSSQDPTIHRGKRSWKDVTAVTLHHTACVLGENPPRWNNLKAHAGITCKGQKLYCADPTVVIWHANYLNRMSFGIEMDGNYEGVAGDPKTLWQDSSEKTKRVAMVPSQALVVAAQDMVRFVVRIVAMHGGKIKYIYAHRQGSADRRADPGSLLWQRVALPLMEELGLTDGGSKFKVGDGYPIPEAWDPRCKGVKY